MKSAVLLSGILVGVTAATPVTAQDVFSDFVLRVQLPSHEAFLTNLGDSAIHVDGYLISSASGSLDPPGWAPLGEVGPEIVAALGPGADGFFVANPSQSSVAELNPFGSATWQAGQSWSIGFPFRSGAPDFVLDAVLQFSSPDGLVLAGGTVVPPGELAQAAVMVVPEPSTAAAAALAILIGAMIRTYKKTAATERRRRTETSLAIRHTFCNWVRSFLHKGSFQ
jgi:hypothetical protein